MCLEKNSIVFVETWLSNSIGIQEGFFKEKNKKAILVEWNDQEQLFICLHIDSSKIALNI